MQKSESNFYHGTVFAPKQYLYLKEATVWRIQKMYSFCRCKNLTYLCGTATDPIPRKPDQGRERKFAEIRVYVLPWYRVCTNTMFK